jgi:hypothetical protein
MYLLLILFSILKYTYSSIDDIKVIDSNLDKHIKEHVVATAFTLFENDYDISTISKKLAQEMNIKFGKTWICYTFSSNSNNSSIFIDQELNSYISITYGQINVTLYKVNLVINECKNNTLVIILSLNNIYFKILF